MQSIRCRKKLKLYMKHDRKDFERLNHIYEAILAVQEFTENVNEVEFRNSALIQSAVIRQFEIIGEAASNISTSTKEKYSEVEWRIIKDFRNILIHEYFRVDASEVWYSIKFDIPDLKIQIESILSL